MAATLVAEVTISLRIENMYEDGEEIIVYETITVAPPDSLLREVLDEWAEEHIYPLTGTGRTDGDSWYDVKIIESTDPDLLGRTFDWGY